MSLVPLSLWDRGESSQEPVCDNSITGIHQSSSGTVYSMLSLYFYPNDPLIFVYDACCRRNRGVICTENIGILLKLDTVR